MSEIERELYSRHADAQSRYAYYLIALAAAGIAFTVHATAGQPLRFYHAPFGLAVACWAASMGFGLAYERGRASIISMNFDLVRYQNGRGPDQRIQPELAAELLREIIEESAAPNGRRWRWQWNCLVLGGASYIVGHINTMALLSLGRL